MINPVASYTLDGRPMEGTTYPEHLALGVSLDSRLTEGASCLEPLEQSVFSLSLAARSVEGVVEKVSDWKPGIQPVQDSTPDGQPMEGTAYLEHSALGVSLDSGIMEGMLCTEPLDRSVLGALLFRATGRDRHARATSSGITDTPRTSMFYIVGAADAGY